MIQLSVAIGVLVTELVLLPLYFGLKPARGFDDYRSFVVIQFASSICFPIGIAVGGYIARRMTMHGRVPSPFPFEWWITAGTGLYCLYWSARLLGTAAQLRILPYSLFICTAVVGDWISPLPFNIASGQRIGAAVILYGLARVLLPLPRVQQEKSKNAEQSLAADSR